MSAACLDLMGKQRAEEDIERYIEKWKRKAMKAREKQAPSKGANN